MTTSAELRAFFERAWGPSLEWLCDANQPLSFAPLAQEAQSALQSQAASVGAAERLRSLLVDWLWSRNQFLELDEPAQGALRESIERALDAIAASGELDAPLATHRTEVASFVRSRLGPTPRDVVAAAYSPELQWRVLGLTDDALRAPVLDVGCGPDAALVLFLRARGESAQGLDRALAPELGLRGDWLSFDYGKQRWGTVLSHLGFSLYFLHHHLAGRPRAYDYARSYMAILAALKPGGRFIYTPGLPFIEALLDASAYRVHRAPFADELRVPVLTDIEQRTGLALSHATHVQRLR